MFIRGAFSILGMRLLHAKASTPAAAMKVRVPHSGFAQPPLAYRTAELLGFGLYLADTAKE